MDAVASGIVAVFRKIVAATLEMPAVVTEIVAARSGMPAGARAILAVGSRMPVDVAGKRVASEQVSAAAAGNVNVVFPMMNVGFAKRNVGRAPSAVGLSEYVFGLSNLAAAGASIAARLPSSIARLATAALTSPDCVVAAAPRIPVHAPGAGARKNSCQLPDYQRLTRRGHHATLTEMRVGARGGGAQIFFQCAAVCHPGVARMAPEIRRGSLNKFRADALTRMRGGFQKHKQNKTSERTGLIQ
jgi:hypothetical protein